MGRRKGGRRARLAPAGTESGKISVPAAQRGLHAGPTPPYELLSVPEVDRLIEATLEVMRDAGVAFDPDPPVMDLFRDAGCTVSDEGVVGFPSEVVRRCLDTMARSVRLWDRNGTDFIELDNRHTWFIPGMTCIRVYDETGEPRDSTREDLARITRVADVLPNVDAVTVTVKNVERSDIHGEVDEFMALAENTTKPLEYLCEYPESLGVVIDMAAAIRGGHETLAEKPYFLQLVTPLPMYYAKAHTDQILTAVEAGVPVGMGTVTIGGAAAPITMGGCLVHSLATDFAGMVLAQLARPGCFCIGGSDPNFMEVATGGVGSFTQTSLGDMAMCQVARRLDYPSLTGIGGCSVARRFNQDAVWELSSSMMQTWYSRPTTCDYMGSLDQGLTYSLHALLFCDELAGALRRMWEGVRVDDERLALELTRQEGPRGDYLTQAHTARHCRTEPWDARFLGPHIPVSTGGDPDRDLFERIEEELCDILERHQPEPIPPRVRATLRGLQADFEATHSVQE